MEQNYKKEIMNIKGKREYKEQNINPEEYSANLDGIDNDQIEEGEGEEEDDDDDRLTYTLITLDLVNLIHIFEDNNISFVDMLLLTKEDLVELQLDIYQRNRILNFSELFNKYAKNYSIQEISDFFTFNKQFIFNSIIYDKVSNNNMNNELQNDLNNNEIDSNNINYNINNQEKIYLNTEPVRQNIINNNIPNNTSKNFLYDKVTTTNIKKHYVKNSNPVLIPKLKETQLISQNINGALNPKLSNKIITQKNNNKKSNLNNDDNINQAYFHNELMEVVKKKKITKQKINRINNNGGININKNKMNPTEINKNEEFQKILEKIETLENSEMNYDLYTKFNLIKNYINMKGDKMSSEDLININKDLQYLLNIANNNIKNILKFENNK